MATLTYTTPGSTGFDMRTLNFDDLVAGRPVAAFNPFIVQWKAPGSSNYLAVLGDSLDATVSGGALTGLTGTRMTSVTVFDENFNIGFHGLDVAVNGFFDLVQAKNWAGLAEFVRQGDDRVVGTKNADVLLGGDGDDIFAAGQGRDRVNGGRGNDTIEATEGRDVLTGGSGADTFAFEAPPADGFLPTITDFRHGIDRISVQDIVFNHVGFGGFDGAPMDAIHFGYGRQAKSEDQGLIYDRARGFLYYDADGSLGAADRVLVAKFGAGTVVAFDDFWVV